MERVPDDLRVNSLFDVFKDDRILENINLKDLELNDAKKTQNEIINLIKNRSLSNELDMNYMNEKMRKKSDYVLPKNPGLV